MKRLITAVAIILILITGAAAFGQDVPKLSEVESLKIQVLNLQIQLRQAQSQMAELTQAFGECRVSLLKDNAVVQRTIRVLQDEINKNHEGFNFNIETGQFTPKAKPIEPDKK